ncbi:hypothetical protein P4E94_09470 [Pontiellaceae bacterium B12219]|nr:hypothetical protein [Pontiellaceae bacterium B12219]
MKMTAKGLAVAVWVGLAVSVFAAPPTVLKQNTAGVVNYQGRLINEDGTAYETGTYEIEFRLYNVSNGGDALWGAKHFVYAKDGYFGVMLGAPDGEALVFDEETQTAVPLWQAMWFDEFSDPANQELYLGITVKQDGNGNTIQTPEESAPRQQFLNTPFAFRAMQAEYARRSNEDFDVGGDLTVEGNSDIGADLVVKADLDVAGSINASSISSSDHLSVTASSLNLSGDLTAGSLKATGGVTASDITLQNNAVIGGDLSVGNNFSTAETITAKNLTLTDSATVSDDLTVSDSLNVGGSLKMNGDYPIYIESYSFSAGSSKTLNTEVSSSDYTAVIAGFNQGSYDMEENDTRTQAAVYMYKSGSSWYIKYCSNYGSSYSGTAYVHVMFIRNELCHDDR